MSHEHCKCFALLNETYERIVTVNKLIICEVEAENGTDSEFRY